MIQLLDGLRDRRGRPIEINIAPAQAQNFARLAPVATASTKGTYANEGLAAVNSSAVCAGSRTVILRFAGFGGSMGVAGLRGILLSSTAFFSARLSTR